MKPRQIAMKFRTWGGKRKGAGAKKRLRHDIEHGVRERIRARLPVHVTLRMHQEVASLRTKRTFAAVAQAFWRAQGRFGMRLTHFSVQSNHIHLIVEGVSAQAMQGLNVRIAKGLNRRLGRSGKVLDHRYHQRALKTPTEVRQAVNYVLNNHHHHTGFATADPFTSVAQPQICVKPQTWLLTHAPP